MTGNWIVPTLHWWIIGNSPRRRDRMRCPASQVVKRTRRARALRTLLRPTRLFNETAKLVRRQSDSDRQMALWAVIFFSHHSNVKQAEFYVCRWCCITATKNRVRRKSFQEVCHTGRDDMFVFASGNFANVPLFCTTLAGEKRKNNATGPTYTCKFSKSLMHFQDEGTTRSIVATLDK